jgi:hypothetical protein
MAIKAKAIAKPISAAIKVKAAPVASKAQADKPAKKDKPKKVKKVRDSFSMPESDYANLAVLKQKCLDAGVPVKKSDLLRAGLLSLNKLSNASLVAAVKKLQIIK